MEKHAFEIEVSNDSGDSIEIHVSENMSTMALMEQSVHKLFPQATTPITEYTISVNGHLYPEGTWQGKKVAELGIIEDAEVMIFGPSPKG